MQEVLPGVYHWTARHPMIHIDVSSYWLDEHGVLIDPLVPVSEGLDWFASRPASPTTILLSNRHHYRESDRFVERYGARVLCNKDGLHEFSSQQVEGFEIGDILPGGVVACELDAICPDDTALHLPEKDALLFADGVVKAGDGPLGFVPDSMMDDPPQTRRGLLAGCARLLEDHSFSHVLLAHGPPLIGDGRILLLDMADSGGRTAI